MMNFKTATLSAAMLVAATIAANAQETASAPPINPTQVAPNPSFSYSYTRTSGPSSGHSAFIPSNPSSSVAASASTGARSGEGTFYSKKGFAPAPN